MSQAASALAELIAKLSYRKGTFRLASGRESDFYVDVKQTVFTAAGSELVGRAICDLLQPAAITSVGGMALGAIPLVSATLSEAARREYTIDGFFVRKDVKEHGTATKLDGRYNAGARIARLADVVPTGEPAQKAIDAVENAGGKDSLIVAVVDREENDGIARLRARVDATHALVTRSQIVAL
jgi:orotate phosphoribosyltransferase